MGNKGVFFWQMDSGVSRELYRKSEPCFLYYSKISLTGEPTRLQEH